MKNAELKKIYEKAEQHHEQMTAFLRDLVRIPSVNGRESERLVAERIVAEGSRLGLTSYLKGKDDSRPNALVSFGEGEHEFAIISHIDTVAEGKWEDWETLPFDAAIRNGRMYGRGTADNKAGIAVGIYTMLIMRDLGLIDPKQQKIIMAGVVDEESGACSPLGVRYLLDEGAIRSEGAIYAYASDVVCIGHRGLLRLQVTTLGESVHAGLEAWHNHTQGENAVTGLAEILVELEKIKHESKQIPGFEHLGFTITPGTMISGGDYASIVPNRASAIVDIRLLPGQEIAPILEKINTIVKDIKNQRPKLEVDIAITVDFPGAAIPIDHPLAKIAQSYTKEVYGKAWQIKGAGPGNEGYMLIGAGIPTLCGFGPIGGNPHAPNEWVDLDSMKKTVAIFSGTIFDYLSQKAV